MMVKPTMKFPQDLLRFLYWIFFRPFSLHKQVSSLDPTLWSAAALLRHSNDQSARSLKYLALFYILVAPWLLALGTGMVLSQPGMTVNWLKLAFTLSVGIALSISFTIPFCIAFLLPFSVAVAILSSTSFTPGLGYFFSLMLGLAYGLNADTARWGLVAGLVYGVCFSLLLGLLGGLTVGAAFLIGYFRIIFYIVEAPLSWILAVLAQSGDALWLWQFHPVRWDELIWFPLPGLDKHLLAIQRQDEQATNAAIHHVQESFRQGWAAEQVAQQH